MATQLLTDKVRATDTRPKIEGEFEGKNLLSIDQFSRSDIEKVLSLTANIDAALDARDKEKHNPLLRIPQLLSGFVFKALMFEASSRTADGYMAAAARLGAKIIQPNIATSSQSKGEIDIESVVCFARGADGLLIRHGAAGFMDEVARRIDPRTQFTSGGNPEDHVTQTLKDLYLLKKRYGKIDGSRIIMAGHMSRYRAAISLLKGLSKFKDIHVTLVTPESGGMPAHIIEYARSMGIKVDEAKDLRPLLKHPGFFYIGRPALEYAESEAEKDEIKAEYDRIGCVVSHETMEQAHPEADIAHPLPHNGEISNDFYTDQRAIYEEQQSNGLPVHMAVLCLQYAQSELERLNTFSNRATILNQAA